MGVVAAGKLHLDSVGGVCMWYLGVGMYGAILFSHFCPGVELDKREVPKCQLAKTGIKGGGANIFPRHYYLTVGLFFCPN